MRIIKAILDDIITMKNQLNIKKKWIIVGKNPGSYNYKYKGYMNCYNLNKSHPKQPRHEVMGCEKKGLIENGINYQKHKLFKNIINKSYNKHFIYIDAYELYCDKKYCNNFTEDNHLVYSDSHHFTYQGSKKIVNKILETLNEVN